MRRKFGGLAIGTAYKEDEQEHSKKSSSYCASKVSSVLQHKDEDNIGNELWR
jgi:hypothetical protein